MSWVSWKKLCRPKPLGGLGFKDIQHFNDALLAKTSWRILQNPDSLIARILLNKYCATTNFLEAELPNNCSHGWRGIIIGRNVLKRRIFRAIGDGKSTKIWNTPWIPSIPSLALIGPPPFSSLDLFVCDLFTANGTLWNEPLITSMFPLISTNILNIRFSNYGGEDRWMWSGTKDGSYSTRSGYYALIEDEKTLPLPGSCRTRPDWMKDIWHLHCAPKIRMFLWRTFRGALPVGETLVSHGLRGHFPCPHCGQDESLYHTFFECRFAHLVWELIQWKATFVYLGVSFEEAFMNSLHLTALPPLGVGLGPLSPWILWSIWKTRNLLIFQQRHVSHVDTLSRAIRDARDWMQSQPLKTTVPSHPLNPHLPLDTSPVLATSAFADAAWDSSHLVSGLGFCFTDPHTGRTQTFSIAEDHVSSSVIGEGLAILAALKKAIELDLSRLRIFSDSKECIDYIKSHSSHRELHGILCDIHALTPFFTSLSFHFVPRSFTSHVDCLAKQALRDFVLDKNFGDR